jgi:hypothetical protein
MRPIAARSVPPTDKLLRDVKPKTPKSYYGASVDAHIEKSTSKTNPTMATSPPEATAESTGDLHSALMEVGNRLARYENHPADWGTVGHALKSVAAAIKSPTIPGTGSVEPKGAPKIGEDRSGLFGTPSPDKEAV